MTETKSFKDLIVWQRSMELVTVCYEIVSLLPPKETYALSNQVVRASVSIPSNIAEGYRRSGRPEYLQFCSIAAGSAAELETQLLIVQKVYKPQQAELALSLVTEVQKMLYALIKQLRATKP